MFGLSVIFLVVGTFSLAADADQDNASVADPTGTVQIEPNAALVQCYRYQSGACGLILGATDPSTCFSTQEQCEAAQTCYENEGGTCIRMHRSADGERCFATRAECETCFENEGGMCIQMHRAADGSRCFATAAECERTRRLGLGTASATVAGVAAASQTALVQCYRYQSGACGLILGATDPSTCFATQEQCEVAQTCYENEGGTCIRMHRSADSERCFATRAECETCFENEGGTCIQMHRAADGSRCFATVAECNQHRRLADIHV